MYTHFVYVYFFYPATVSSSQTKLVVLRGPPLGRQNGELSVFSRAPQGNKKKKGGVLEVKFQQLLDSLHAEPSAGNASVQKIGIQTSLCRVRTNKQTCSCRRSRVPANTGVGVGDRCMGRQWGRERRLIRSFRKIFCLFWMYTHLKKTLIRDL